VNTVSDKNVNTARPKVVVNTARPKAVLNAIKGNQVNAVKASACWGRTSNSPPASIEQYRGNVDLSEVVILDPWEPSQIQVNDGLGPQKRLIFLPHVQGNPQMDLQDQGVINSGCSRHMTGNMSYLTDFEEIDGGYVAFGGNPKGGKITCRGS
ncbi:hypothetical protein Tco_0068707, partial [Tanacetum coccineum]